MIDGTQRTRSGGVWILLGVSVVLTAVLGVGVIVGLRSDGQRVLVVGDSVTYQSAGDLQRTFDWTPTLDVQGRSGYRSDQLLPLARERIEGNPRPDVVVFMTGYNDVSQDADTTDAVEEMVELAASVPCAVWVLIPTKGGGYPPARVEAFNDHVVRLASEHPTVHVETGWRDAVDAGDGDIPDPAFVSEDRVHPNDGGTKKIAEVMEAAVSRHCR